MRHVREKRPGVLELRYGGAGFAEVLAAVKALPVHARKWDPQTKAWEVRSDATSKAAVEALLNTHGFNISRGASVATISQINPADDPEMVAMSSAVTSASSYEGSRSGLTPRPYQLADVDYLLRARRSFLANDMGVGKTAGSLIASREANAFPLVICCPATLKRKWAREAADWLFRGAIVQILDSGRDSVSKRADVVIVNYDLLHHDEGRGQKRGTAGLASKIAAIKPAGMICDESHLLRNPTTRRARAVYALARTAGIDWRLLLSGTATVNSPVELGSQLALLGRAQEFGGWSWFSKYYREHTRKSDLDTLNRWLRSVCYRRIEKKDGLPGMPPKGNAVIPWELSNRDEYELVRRDVRAWLREQGRSDTFGVEAKLAHLRQVAAKGKLPAAYEWIGDFLESGEQLVVFAWHTSIVQAIADKFNAPMIYGATPQHMRDRICQRFQAGDERLVVCNIQAGGVGIDLYAASNVLFLELPWTPAEFDQATDRCHRLGQERPVTAWVAMAEGTIDEKIWNLLEAKRQVTEVTNKGLAAAMLAQLAEEV